MSYIKNLLSSSEEIESTLKSILKETPEVSFSNFFEGFGLKTYVKFPGFYSSAYIKEKWAKRFYSNPEKIEEAHTNVTQILDQFQEREQDTNLINNYKIIADSLKTEDEEITKEKIIQFLYRNSIIIEFVSDGVDRKPEISKSNITLMQFLFKYFTACKKSDFANEVQNSLQNLKALPTHCVMYRNNKISANELSSTFKNNQAIITNIFRYDAIPEDVIFFKFTSLPNVNTSPEDFVLIYLNEYPNTYFPVEGIQGKESIKFMNFLPVFQNYKEYQFPMVEENTPVACRGEEEIVIGCKDFMKIIPTQKKLEELFTDTFRQKGKIVLEGEHQLETDKINYIASPNATDLGFFAPELKIHKSRLTNVHHIPIKDPNDIIQRESFLALEYDYNTFSWWLTDKGSLYGRKVLVENSGHEKIKPSTSETFNIGEREYKIFYYDLSQDTNYFVNIEYLVRNTRLVLKLGSVYDYEFNKITEQGDTAVNEYLKKIFKDEYQQYGTAAGGKVFSGKLDSRECFLKIYDKPMNLNIRDQMSSFEDIVINFIPFKIADNLSELTGEEIYLGEQSFEDAIKIITVTPPLNLPNFSVDKAKKVEDMLMYISNCNNHGYLVYDILLNREQDGKLVSNWLYTKDDRIVITDLGAYYKNNRNEFKRYYQAYKRRHKIPNDEVKPMVWQMYLAGVLCYQVWKESVEIPNTNSPLIIKDNEKLESTLQKFIDLKYNQLNDKIISEIVKDFMEAEKIGSKNELIIQNKNVKESFVNNLEKEE